MKKNYLLFCFFIIVLSSFFLVCSSSDQAGRFSKEKNDASTNSGDIVSKDSLPKRVETNNQEKPVINKDSAAKVIEGQTDLKKEVLYAVQLGAFKEIKNVEKFEKMVKKDFPDIFMKTEPDDPSKTFKITIGKFDVKTDAYKLRDYCVDKGYKDAWVITIPK
jgi:hypothetical protein